MDIEQLIREVHARPALWNQKSTNYYYREVVAQKWNEIAKACDMPCEAVRCKWKHLRDNFRKEFKKDMEARNSGTSEKYTPQWVWYKSLWFLGDQLLTKKINTKRSFSGVKPPKGTTKIEHSVADDSKDSIYDATDSDTETLAHAVSVYESEESLADDSAESVSKNIIDDSTTESNDKNLTDNSIESSGKRKSEVPHHREASSKKMKCSDKCPGNDDTYHFLMSLLTPLRILPYDRSMIARLKIQNIVTEEVAKLSGVSVPCAIDGERNSDENSTPMSPNVVNLSECDY
ncbi:uncharacterized protein [Parasteatoda tepidariorum]|uniref:uncharacterized protein n=1 Tax=Parasteatoda tepidariorum TaxID=114398 RepID=UPI001C720E4C|nr:uncharacterized protein LOC107449290 [Parasteatoda tepidariorum]